MNLQKTIDKLVARFEEAGWEEITITMKCNGDELTISPCFAHCDIKKKKENAEYFLVYGPMPWMGRDTIEELAKDLIDYENILKAQRKAEANLKAYFEEHIKDGNYEPEEWSWYSDWHKDITGHRPRGIVCDVA